MRACVHASMRSQPAPYPLTMDHRTQHTFPLNDQPQAEINIEPQVGRSPVPSVPSPAGDGADNQQGFFARDDGVRQRGIGGVVGKVFPAGVESQVGTAPPGDVVADGAGHGRISGLQRIQHRALGDRLPDVKLHLPIDVCQGPQVGRQFDPNYRHVCTSTDNTRGRF